MAEIPYTVRLAPELLERIERTARCRGIAPRQLVRAVLAESSGGSRALHAAPRREKMVMNLSRPAIRFEVNRSSAAMSLRLWLRVFLLWILVWAASDLFFVWYWTGRLGPGAHEYFGRWFLAWLFTQKLPLYFLSLPYGKGRYTIGSMYAFLNWRFYLGRSL